MKKYITRIIAVLMLASVIGSISSCAVEYRDHPHHDDYHHDGYYH